RERHRDVAPADDDQQRRWPEDLDERADVLEEERARDTLLEHGAGFGGEAVVEEAVTERSESRAIVEDDELAGLAFQPRHDHAAAPARRVRAHAVVERGVGIALADRQRLDEHLDRATARE